MWGTHDGMGWWMLFGGLLWIAFWVSIVWLLVSAFRPERRRAAEDDALAIARARYARGEISREEFLRLQADLTGTNQTG